VTTFICTETDCSNKDVEYNFDGEIATAECGGCGLKLEPIA